MAMSGDNLAHQIGRDPGLSFCPVQTVTACMGQLFGGNMTEQEAIAWYLSKSTRARKNVNRIANWDKNGTLFTNAKILGSAYSNTAQFAKKYNLPYINIYKQFGAKTLSRISRLRSKKYTYREIGKMYNRSHETIRQLEKGAK